MSEGQYQGMKIFTGFSKRWLLPLLLCVLMWFVISKGDPASWIVGLPCIALAVFAIERMHTRGKLSIRAGLLPGFIAWFLWNSFKGGVDVALRASRPRLSLQPGFLRYPLRLPQGHARLFLVNVVSLLPGTLSADIEGNELVLHCLDTGADIIVETSDAEQRIAVLFGISQD